MKHAALLIVGAEGRLAELLAEWARARHLVHQALRRPRACLNLARRNPAAVVILKLGRDLEQELTLLERLTTTCPETPCVVVGDVHNPSLAALSWDLGACYVLFPPQPVEKLPGLLQGFFPSVKPEAGHE
jgi:DNA-binding NtrC family response regulator